MNNLEKLLEYLKKVGNLRYTISILRWEMDTTAPKSSYDYLIDVSTNYELEIFKLVTSNEYITLIENVINSDEFDKLEESEKKYIADLKEDFNKFKNVPEDFYQEYCKLKNNSLNSWVEAKEKNDYNTFKSNLIKIIDYTKKYYKYMYPNTTNLYDSMLNEYEEGITTEFIDKLFDELKTRIMPIIKNLKNTDIKKLNTKYSDSELLDVSKYMLDYIGFDNNRGALGIYTHGYTAKMNNNDVRIAFSNDADIIDLFSTVIHEGGHGIFEQNISDSLKKYETYDINKYALHESQSRFYENMLGRNINFWIPIYDDIKNKLNIDLPIEEFISMFNNAKRSLVRTKADELTYCMHIIIRYEIERDIFNDNIDLNNLPSIWNSKYKEYLGLDIENDSEGILQDMHWSDGSFGYFPSYLLGSIFDGMLLEIVNEKVGNIDELLRNGKIKEITTYLNENIHKFGGAYNVNEVSNRLCGKDLEVEPLVKYFESKYSD